MTFNEWVKKTVVIDKETRGGLACFVGSRVSIKHVAELTKDYVTYSFLFDEFPWLTTEDIRFAVMYYERFCAVSK